MKNPKTLSQLVACLDGETESDKIRALTEFADNAQSIGNARNKVEVQKSSYRDAEKANALIYYLRNGSLPSSVSDPDTISLRDELIRQRKNPRPSDPRLGYPSNSDDD